MMSSQKAFVLIVMTLLSLGSLRAQDLEETHYFQLKVDFLEPIVNRAIVGRFDFGFGRHAIGIVGGVGGRISKSDNKQYDTYQDKINFRIGTEYQYFLSQKKQNRGFFVGGDLDFGSRTIQSKVSNENSDPILVITPGVWFGYLLKPFKKAPLYLDLTIIHPRYALGKIAKVDFQTVDTPYVPDNRFSFLGPWSIAWRF